MSECNDYCPVCRQTWEYCLCQPKRTKPASAAPPQACHDNFGHNTEACQGLDSAAHRLSAGRHTPWTPAEARIRTNDSNFAHYRELVKQGKGTFTCDLCERGDEHFACNWVFVPRGSAEVRAIDGKFSTDGSRIFNTVSGEEIPLDEPLFLLRGRDNFALAAIHAYQVATEGQTNKLHQAGVQQVRERFCQFAAEHPERMKKPGITRHLKLESVGSAEAREPDVMPAWNYVVAQQKSNEPDIKSKLFVFGEVVRLLTAFAAQQTAALEQQLKDFAATRKVLAAICDDLDIPDICDDAVISRVRELRTAIAERDRQAEVWGGYPDEKEKPGT